MFKLEFKCKRKMFCLIFFNLSLKTIFFFCFKSQEFWIILRAIKEFTENEGCGLLPVKIKKRNLKLVTYLFLVFFKYFYFVFLVAWHNTRHDIRLGQVCRITKCIQAKSTARCGSGDDES